jgi:ThiF family
MLFGADGQNHIKAARVGVAGLGGLGCHLVQHLTYLGASRYVLVDGDRASNHSLNRLVTAYPDDVGQYKTDLAERLIRTINPDAEVVNIRHHLPRRDAIEALTGVDLILGGLDTRRITPGPTRSRRPGQSSSGKPLPAISIRRLARNRSGSMSPPPGSPPLSSVKARTDAVVSRLTGPSS